MLLDFIMIPLLTIGLIMAFWTQFWLKLTQFAILCAVVESDYFWHWAPPKSATAVQAGLLLSFLVTGYWCGWRNGDFFSREGRARRLASPPPLWLLRLRDLRQPGQLLTGDDGGQRRQLR